MKAGLLHAVLLVSVVFLSSSQVGQGQGLARRLKQVITLCDPNVDFNFFIAPGFGCFLQINPCGFINIFPEWVISDTSRLRANQNPNNTITNMR